MKRIGCAVIGVGYWGPNLVRNLLMHTQFDLKCVVDHDVSSAKEKLKSLGASGINLLPNLDQFLNSYNPRECPLVCVATPPESHREISLALLRSGFSVFIEKPLGLNFDEKREIVEESVKAKSLLFVDFTYLHTQEYLYLKSLVDSKKLGNLSYYISNRVNLGRIQESVSVVDDLAIHDLAILDSLMPDSPVSVSCFGSRSGPTNKLSTAFVQIKYASDVIASINVSWNSTVKLRDIYISGDRGTASWNDLEGFDKIKVFYGHISPPNRNESKIQYHLGDGIIPSITPKEAIRTQFDSIATAFHSRYGQIERNQQILRLGKLLHGINNSYDLNGELVSVR